MWERNESDEEKHYDIIAARDKEARVHRARGAASIRSVWSLISRFRLRNYAVNNLRVDPRSRARLLLARGYRATGTAGSRGTGGKRDSRNGFA